MASFEWHIKRTWRRNVREKRRGLPRAARSRPHSVRVSLVPWGTPTCSRNPYIDWNVSPIPLEGSF